MIKPRSIIGLLCLLTLIAHITILKFFPVAAMENHENFFLAYNIAFALLLTSILSVSVIMVQNRKIKIFHVVSFVFAFAFIVFDVAAEELFGISPVCRAFIAKYGLVGFSSPELFLIFLAISPILLILVIMSDCIFCPSH